MSRSITQLFQNSLKNIVHKKGNNNPTKILKKWNSHDKKMTQGFYVLVFQAQDLVKHTPTSFLNFLILEKSRLSMSKFTNWFLLGRCFKSILQDSTNSIMKWFLISMCLVLKCNNGFMKILMTLELSQYIVATREATLKSLTYSITSLNFFFFVN